MKDFVNEVYKFRAPSNDGALNEFSLKILRDGELFLSKPSSFNDIFDTRIPFKPVASYGINESIEYYVKQKDKLKEINADYDLTLKILNTPQGQEEMRKNIGSLIENESKIADFFRIFCLSKSWNNPAMWGYYASNCRGIAIGFKTGTYQESVCIDVDPNSFSKDEIPGIGKSPYSNCVSLINVDYSNHRPEPLNFFTYDKKDIEIFIRTKAEVWRHEDEYRILTCEPWLTHKDPSVIYVSDGVINEILIGIAASEELEKQVIDLVRDPTTKCHNATVYKLKKDPLKFEFKKIKILSQP